jgi:hypothetical protein
LHYLLFFKASDHSCPEWWINLDEGKQKYIESLIMDYDICNKQAIELLVDEIGLTYSDSEQFLLWWFKDNDKLDRVNKKYFLLTVKYSIQN